MKKMAEITKGLDGQPTFKLLRTAGGMEEAACRVLHFEVGGSNFRAQAKLFFMSRIEGIIANWKGTEEDELSPLLKNWIL